MEIGRIGLCCTEGVELTSPGEIPTKKRLTQLMNALLTYAVLLAASGGPQRDAAAAAPAPEARQAHGARRRAAAHARRPRGRQRGVRQARPDPAGKGGTE